MPTFEFDYEFKLPAYGSVILEADDKNDGEYKALELARETEEPDASGFEITGWREIKDAA